MLLYRTGQYNLLKITSLLHEVGNSILMGYAGDILLDYRSGIKIGGHIMACGADELDSTVISRMIRLCTDKCREK